MIERQQSLFRQRREELNGEEGIAGRLLVHQVRQLGGVLGRAAQRIGDQPSQIDTGERREGDLLRERTRLANRVEHTPQRMGGIDLIVPIGADDQQVPHILAGQQILEQIERRRVEPLQVVEEQNERMFGPGEDADESPEHELKTPLRVLWREIRNGRRFSDDELQLGDDVDHEACGRAERLAQGLAPAAQLSLALAQKRSDQALKGLRQGRIRDVALVLIKFA